MSLTAFSDCFLIRSKAAILQTYANIIPQQSCTEPSGAQENVSLARGTRLGTKRNLSVMFRNSHFC